LEAITQITVSLPVSVGDGLQLQVESTANLTSGPTVAGELQQLSSVLEQIKWSGSSTEIRMVNYARDVFSTMQKLGTCDWVRVSLGSVSVTVQHPQGG